MLSNWLPSNRTHTRTVLVLCLALPLLVAATCPAELLKLTARSGPEFPPGPSPTLTSLVTGLFDGDEWDDVVVGSGSPTGLWYATGRVSATPSSFLYNSGDLTDTGTVPAAAPHDLVALDWNSDGDVDVLAVSDAGVEVLLGNGAFGFTSDGMLGVTPVSGTPLRVLPYADGVAVAGTAAGVVVVSRNGSVAVWSGSVGAADALALGVLDVNSDGLKDLAVLSTAGQLVFIDAVSRVSTVWDSGIVAPLNMAVGDLSGDGADDLLLIRTGEALMYASSPLGGLLAHTQSLFLLADVQESPIIVDINGDGANDILLLSSGSDALAAINSGAGGTFRITTEPFYTGFSSATLSGQAYKLMPLRPNRPYPAITASSDSSSDDIVTIMFTPPNAPAVASTTTISVSGSDTTVLMATADFDLDGDADILEVTASAIAWRANNGDKSFRALAPILIPLTHQVSAITVGDVVGLDGKPDVIYASPAAGAAVSVIVNVDGGSTWSTPVPLALGGLSDTPVVSLLLADIDGDRFLDIVALAPACLAWAPGSPAIGESAPLFAPFVAVDTAFTNGTDMAAGDVTGDGATDLVVLSVTHGFRVYGSSGSGVPATALGSVPSSTAPLGPFTPRHIGLGLVDPVDSRLDLVYVGDSDVAARLNDGTGAFPSVYYTDSTTRTIQDAAFGDFAYSDGLVDIIGPTSSEYGWQNKNGTLSPFIDEFGGDLRSILLMIDANGDGIMDMGGMRTSTQHRIGVARPSLTRRPPSRVIPAVTLHTVAQIAAALKATSNCWSSHVQLEPDTVYTGGCSNGAHFVVPDGATWTISTRDGGPPATLDCGPAGGVMFDVQGSGVLMLDNVILKGATHGTGPDATTGLRVSGSDARLVLTDVTVQEFSSVGTSPFQSLSGMGGAVVVFNGRLEAYRCRFLNNEARLAGGALVAAGSQAVVHLSDCDLMGNTANGLIDVSKLNGGGGAIVVVGAGARLDIDRGSLLSGNRAVAGVGGAIFVQRDATGASVTVTDSVLEANTAHGAGGAVAHAGASGASVSLGTGAVVRSNVAGWGGALAAYHADIVVPQELNSGGLARTPASVPGGSAIVAGPGSTLGGGTATYGGAVFACGAHVDVTGASVSPGAEWKALVGGGASFVCLPSTSGGTVDTVAPPGAGGWGTVVSSDGYGPETATPPSSMAAVPGSLPVAVVSGVAWDAGTVTLMDALGQPVVDGGLLLTATPAAASAADVVVGSTLFEARMSAATGSGSLASLALVLRAAAVATTAPPAGPGTLDASVVVSLVGAPASVASEVSLDVALAVSVCAPDYGRASDENADLVCELCNNGGFSDELSTAPCQAIPECPPNTLRLSANTTTDPCVCDRGFWVPSGLANQACLPCPAGGVCNGGLDKPVAGSGFFPANAEGTLFLECPNAKACVGNGQCQTGYRGRLCGQCASGYYALRGSCFKCKSKVNAVITLLLLFGAIGACAALVGFSLAESVRYKFAAAMIGFNALQISAIYGKLELDWGEFAAVYFDIASSLNVNFELTSPECSVASGTDTWVLKLWLTLLLPVFVGLGMAAVAGVFLVLGRLAVPWFRNHTMDQLREAVGRAWFQSLVLLYLPLTSAAFSVFACHKDESGRWILDGDPTRQCFDSAWWGGLFLVGLVAVALYAFAIPSAVVWLLYTRRSSLDELSFVLKFGFLVARFADKTWWFEAAIMARKLAVVMCMTFFFSTEAKANAAVLVLAGCVLHVGMAQPYLSRFHSGLAVLVLSATSCVLYAGTFADYGLRRFGVVLGVLVNVIAILVGNGVDIWLMTRSEAEISENEFFKPDMLHMDTDMEVAPVGAAAGMSSTELTVQDVEPGTLVASVEMSPGMAVASLESGGAYALNSVDSVGPVGTVGTAQS